MSVGLRRLPHSVAASIYMGIAFTCLGPIRYVNPVPFPFDPSTPCFQSTFLRAELQKNAFIGFSTKRCPRQPRACAMKSTFTAKLVYLLPSFTAQPSYRGYLGNDIKRVRFAFWTKPLIGLQRTASLEKYTILSHITHKAIQGERC